MLPKLDGACRYGGIAWDAVLQDAGRLINAVPRNRVALHSGRASLCHSDHYCSTKVAKLEAIQAGGELTARHSCQKWFLLILPPERVARNAT